MKGKSTYKIFATVLCLASVHAFPRGIPGPGHSGKTIISKSQQSAAPFVYELDPLIIMNQNVQEKGLVMMSGKLIKPVTSDHVKLSVKYKDAQGNWVTGWCKTLYSYNRYNEQLKAVFELPASAQSSYNLKVELSSDTNLTNFSSITWDKTVSHYKLGDYNSSSCDLDENEYTILLTPKKEGTLITDTNGKVTGIKDRVTSANAWNKLGNVIMNNKKDDVIFSPKNPATLFDNNGIKSVKMINQSAVSDTLGATPEFIYHEMPGHPIPYLYTYNDPVYMFAGKFSISGMLLKFSQWPGEPNGPGYHNFKNPNQLQSRYFNLYNTIFEKLSDFIADQEPVVIVSSLSTGFRVYKSNGQSITIKNATGYSNYGALFFGYGNDQGGARRGPGSENLIISNTPEMTLYGMGALRNDATESIQTVRSMTDIESEIAKFINYVGIFGDVKLNVEGCANSCYTLKSGAVPDNIPVDWTKAPNSYIFTGKNKTGGNADGLYIPVKKAYEMWSKGGEFMRDDNGNYTKIPDGGIAKANLYWEDEPGLIKSVSLEGTGETAKIKVLVDRAKKGNAVVTYKVNDQIYWSWHIWATDDPTNGSTYHHGFEKDKDGNTVTNWKWMDRNLGAVNASFLGNNWHKSAGLQYQWGRKDPFPPFSHKDLSLYSISGEINLAYNDPAFQSKFVKIRGNKYAAQLNTGTDTPNGNIRFSIKNPFSFIATPVYVAKKNDPLLNDGEDFLQQNNNDSWMAAGITTWFSKQKYKQYTSPLRENIVAWDLWGDTRQGNYSDIDDPVVGESSSRYAMKSPYDPCPCNWRVPSSYFSGGRNSGVPMPDENKYSPWGKHTGNGTNTNPEFTANVLNTSYPGIKIYPQFGFDFSGVSGMNLGQFPINGNYEMYPNTTSAVKYGTGWITPVMEFQDQSADGGLLTSTFTTATEVINQVRYTTYGAAGLTLISDPLSATHAKPGWHRFASSAYLGSGGVRCIADPNNAFMPAEFETEFIASANDTYSLETLKSWTKLPNSYVEYTNPGLVTPNPNGNKIDPNKDNDRIIEIPLKKAYAMHKLYLSTDYSFPAESAKSSSVVWTSNKDLIQKMEIIDGSIETAVLKVTLNQNATGNAVVALHVGNGGWTANKHNDPVIWSWHIWAPRSVIEKYTFDPENAGNGGVIPANEQFADPMTSAGVPMKTSFMDRDLGAKLPFINEHIFGFNTMDYAGPLGSYNNFNPTAVARLDQMHDSGGLHYQWGRKDPLPVFYNPGMFYNHFVNGKRPFNDYFVYRQNNPANPITGAIPYTNNILETEYLANYTQPYNTYSAAANVSGTDTRADKLKKVVKYSVNNPLNFLYQPDATKLDWVSDENGNMPDRWGHATEKSAYDPCPAGWRIVDLQSVSTGIILGNLISKGNTPWFYNAKFTSSYGIDPGKDNAFVNNESYDINKMNYVGSFVYGNSGIGSYRYGFVLTKPEYNIGTFPNNGIRGMNGGNLLKDSQLGGNPDTFMKSGIWTSANQGGGGFSLGMFFNATITQTPGANDRLYYLTPTYGFRPQAAMSCRCAEIKYDANGNEIGRYDPNAIAVPKDALKKASAPFERAKVEEMLVKDKLTVYPNPVKNILYIKPNETKEYYYQIYNMSGQMIRSGKFENQKTDLSSLISGAYLVRINNSETLVKIIKE
ncbi:T9SS type A sorting domain-containing protein [Chryseobacterium arthrosphaerae]|uniref:T9SS type A sorting domain-containing protein n=1 Tax=Chryseobacterium arthrosphaerae TaxID=651561 RepID=UPI001BAEF802|nr:T9SS type A sorting domain-containing protein [Chryseobacterium arthrosphaerae]QUY55568.1 T9SS type A sorting domain-containing protein [Chryseobacterium arthrosphaerae]